MRLRSRQALEAGHPLRVSIPLRWIAGACFLPPPYGCRRAVLDPKQLFTALEKGDVDMIAARATDGHLTSPDWKILADDQKVFPPYQACPAGPQRSDRGRARPAARPGGAIGEVQRRYHAQAECGSGRVRAARGGRGCGFPDAGRAEVKCSRLKRYATGCGSGRTPRCRRHRSIHCLVSFSCTPFCESRVRSVPQST